LAVQVLTDYQFVHACNTGIIEAMRQTWWCQILRLSASTNFESEQSGMRRSLRGVVLFCAPRPVRAAFLVCTHR